MTDDLILHVPVNRDCTVLDVCTMNGRARVVEHDLAHYLDEIYRRGPPEVEIRIFDVPDLARLAVIEGAYASRGLRPADPFELGAAIWYELSRIGDRPVMTHGQDGGRWQLTFARLDGYCYVALNRSFPLLFEGCRFAGVPV